MKKRFAIAAVTILGIMASGANVSYADAAFWKEKDREEAVTQEKLHDQKLEIMDAKAEARLRLEEEKKEESFFALEAQLFKVEQDALDSLDAFEKLQADFNVVADQLEVYREKELVSFLKKLVNL